MMHMQQESKNTQSRRPTQHVKAALMTVCVAASEGSSQQERLQEKSEGLGKRLNPGIVSVLRRTLAQKWSRIHACNRKHISPFTYPVPVYLYTFKSASQYLLGVVQQHPPHHHLVQILPLSSFTQQNHVHDWLLLPILVN